jgi:hypothetical protein
MPRRSARYKRKSRNNKLKKYLGIFTLFIVFLLFLGFYAFYKQFHQSYISAASATSDNFGDKDFYSVALISTQDEFAQSPLILDKIKILFVSPKHDNFTVYEVPTDFEVDMPGKFGNEKISKSFALGTMGCGTVGEAPSEDCFSKGLNYTITNLENLTANKIDRFVLVEPSLNDFSEEILINSNPRKFFNRLEIKSLRKSLKTDMTFSDFLHFYSLIRSYSKKDVSHETFNAPENFDAFLRELTFDSNLAEEKKSIAVLNGTSVSGLASFGSRVVKNRGGHVVSVDNAVNNYEESYLIASNKEDLTVKYLAAFFGIKNIYNKGELSTVSSETVTERTDVTLILGLDNSAKY